MIHVIQQSSYEKITGIHSLKPNYDQASVLIGEEFSFQIVLYNDSRRYEKVFFQSESEIPTRGYLVKNVPVNRPYYSDDHYPHYLLDKPGLLPDCLYPLEDRGHLTVHPYPTVLWIGMRASQPGKQWIRFFFQGDEERTESAFHLTVLPHRLPKQWFSVSTYVYPTCLSNASSFPLFSDIHWELLNKYFAVAAAHGTTDLLTPIFPMACSLFPERNPVQLVQISVHGDQYSFQYDLFDCWIMMARKHGIKDFSFSPLFPSLKDQRCPHITVQNGRKNVVLFGRDSDILSPEYGIFLRKFLRDFTKHLTQCGLVGHSSFHLTVGATAAYADVYRKCRETVADLLKRFRIVDLLSDYSFYQMDLISSPVVPLCGIQPFLSERIPSLCTCFSSGEPKEAANQLIASPSARLRSLGIIFYYHDIVGFLNNRFNCYYSPCSTNVINSYINTDGEGAVPSGSMFWVYPDADGPLPSIRIKQFYYALQDMRLLELLERFMSREAVIALIRNSFPDFPDTAAANAEQMLVFRQKINQLLSSFEPNMN